VYIFIRLAVIAPKHEKCCEIPREFDLTAVQGHPSSKVIDLGVNGKPICDFLLVINNFSRICYRFRDIHA